jgi:anaerobic dimethyl sulfoxide reductase subunit A
MRYGLSYRPEDGSNPIAQGTTGGQVASYVSSGIHYVNLADLILKGKAGGYPVEAKIAFIQTKNYLNQYPNINKIVEALKKLEFIAVLEQFMTSTAKFADILLPTTTFMERNDLDFGVGIPFYGFVNKAIEPIGECKSHLDIARELAHRLGVEDFGQGTEEEQLKKEVAESEIPDYEAFKKKGIYKIELAEPYLAFKKQVEDAAKHPFTTPSGKIEIYVKEWADLKDPLVPPVAKYIETPESRNDPLAQKYPLQLITTHFKRRTLSQFDNLPWLRELEEQSIMMSTADARARSIQDGDLVRVFNDRGELLIPARVTERILPGVVDIPHGAWYDPDEQGRDRGGNPNVLTNDQASPGGAYLYNTCLVEVQKL